MNKEEFYYGEFKDKVSRSVDKKLEKVGKTSLWYECWIDFDESYDRWIDFAMNWTNLAVEVVARWVVARDNWYWGPSYIKAINKAMKNHSAEYAFTKVLNDSLKKK